MKNFLVAIGLAFVMFLSGCTAVETGKVGVRVWPNGNIDEREIPTGFAQVMFGSVRHYVANDITWPLTNLHPTTKDKSVIHDLDLVYTYSIPPGQIVELLTKFQGRDAQDDNGLWYPLAHYVENVVSDATSDVFKKYDALDVNINREAIRAQIKEAIVTKLKDEGFEKTITVHQIFIKNLQIDPAIVKSATAVITAQNNLSAKRIEVETAEQEAIRLGHLAANKSNIDYMNANSLADIAAAVREGKVSAIVVPYDFKGIVNIPGAR